MGDRLLVSGSRLYLSGDRPNSLGGRLFIWVAPLFPAGGCPQFWGDPGGGWHPDPMATQARGNAPFLRSFRRLRATIPRRHCQACPRTRKPTVSPEGEEGSDGGNLDVLFRAGTPRRFPALRRRRGPPAFPRHPSHLCGVLRSAPMLVRPPTEHRREWKDAEGRGGDGSSPQGCWWGQAVPTPRFGARASSGRGARPEMGAVAPLQLFNRSPATACGTAPHRCPETPLPTRRRAAYSRREFTPCESPFSHRGFAQS